LTALFLAAPVFAEPSCRTLDAEVADSYEGGCRNGLAHGDGVARGIATYEGGFRRGLKHGHGVKTWPWGDRYEGGFKDDRKHGRGVYTWGSGTKWAGERYEGEFVDDKRQGLGTYTWPNGDRFEGQWDKDQRLGHAAMEQRRQQAQAAQQEALQPGVKVCWVAAPAQVNVGMVSGVVDSFDGSVLRVKLMELPAALANPQAAVAVGQVVADEPVNWSPCA
jgi:hypothetical protein